MGHKEMDSHRARTARESSPRLSNPCGESTSGQGSRQLTWRLAVALLLAACQGPPQPGLPLDARVIAAQAAIEAAWREHIQAARDRDLDRVLAIYADDAIYSTPETPLVRGRDAIRAMEERTLAGNRVLGATHGVDALRVDGDTAYELGTVSGTVAPTGAEPQRVTFHFAAAWRCQAGRWQITHLVGAASRSPTP